MKAKDVEQRDFLLACAAWQDTLLQSYRTLHVTIQGFFIAAGSTVLAVQLTSAIQAQYSKPLSDAIFNVLFTVLLAFLFWLQWKTSHELRDVVESRAQDINFWHQLIILSENPFDASQRKFTYFKMWQQAKRASVDHLLHQFLPPEGVTGQSAEGLIGQGLGHTRQILDVNIFGRLQLLWYVILFCSITITSWFIYFWWLSKQITA